MLAITVIVYTRITYSTIVFLFEGTHDRRPPPPRTTNNDHFPSITANSTVVGGAYDKIDQQDSVCVGPPPNCLYCCWTQLVTQKAHHCCEEGALSD